MTRRTRLIQISDVIRAAVKLPSGLDITDQANTARNQANSAFDHANTAYSHAGNAFNHANNSHNQANSAYAQANAAYSAANTKLNSSGGTISGSLIVTGNLFVEGDSTSFNVASLLIEDSEIYLNNNQTTPSLNASIFAERGSSTDTFIRWNESTDKWGWSDDGSTLYSFDDLRSGLATTNTTFGTINTNIGTAYSQANAAYGQANSAFAAANNRVLKAGDTMTGSLTLGAGRTVGSGGVFLSHTGLNTDVFANGRTASVSTGWGTFRIHQEAGNPGLIIAGDAGQTAPYFRIQNNAESALLIVDSSGNFGLNMTPGRKFDVNGGGRFVQDTAATTGAITLRQNSGDTVPAYIQWVNNAANSERGWMTMDTSSNFILATASAEKLRVTSSGNVGINVTSPGHKLEVSGSLYHRDAYASVGGYNSGGANTPFNRYGPTFGTNITSGQAEVNIWNPTDPATYTSTGILFSQALSNTTRRDLMFLKHDGLVGVGTLSPTGRLHSTDAGFNPGNSTITKASFVASGNYGGGITLNDGGLGTIWMQSTGTVMGFGVGTTSGASGTMYLRNGSVGIAQMPTVSTTSSLFNNGDFTIAGTNRSILGNIYYSGGWKYAANGFGWGFRENAAGLVQFITFPNNTSGAGAAATDTYLMTLDIPNQRVGIGTVSPTNRLSISGTCNATGDFRAPVFYDSDDTNAYFDGAGALVMRGGSPTIYFRDTDHNSAMLHNNSNLLYVLRGGNDTTSWSAVSGQWPFIFNLSNNNATCGGAFDAIGNITAYSSDRRLKTNIKNIPNALDKVLSLNGVTFDWIDRVKELGFTPDTMINDAGVIAQEVQEVLPQAVKPAPFDKEWNKDKETYTSRSGEDFITVQYEKIVPLLIEAIKELKAEIDNLKQRG